MAGLRRISEKFFGCSEDLLACSVELDADVGQRFSGRTEQLAVCPPERHECPSRGDRRKGKLEPVPASLSGVALLDVRSVVHAPLDLGRTDEGILELAQTLRAQRGPFLDILPVP
jgi:hypothetical protein